MALLISLIKAPSNVVLPRKEYSFDKTGGRIGRSTTNEWVLPDPEKFLSSLHCEVIFDKGHYYIEDRSTNGTFANGSLEPIGKGNRFALTSGCTIEMGDYHFTATLTDSDVVDVQSFQSSSLPSNGFELDNSFFETSASTFGIDTPQDPLSSLLSENGTSLFEPSLDEGEMPRLDLSIGSDASSLDDLLGLSSRVNTADSMPSIDLTPQLGEAYTWPSVVRETNNDSLIPENWDDDLLGQNSEEQELNIHEIGGPVFSAATPLEPIKKQSFASKENIDQPLPGSSFSTLHADTHSDFDINTGNHGDKRMSSQVAALTTVVNAEQQINQSQNATQSSIDSALLESLQIDTSRLTEQEKIEIASTIGLAMREVLGGVLSILRSRATIKNEFRMNVTTIQPIENNPLKFSVSIDDALENLFLKKTKAYKKPVDAFREGFQEIAEHQLAMIAGIREGYESMMDRFDPVKLEKNFNSKSKSSLIHALQKAKYWESYECFFNNLRENRDISFQSLFGTDFVSAYEDQLRRAAASRKKEVL